jgi:hypothetical protein
MTKGEHLDPGRGCAQSSLLLLLLLPFTVGALR